MEFMSRGRASESGGSQTGPSGPANQHPAPRRGKRVDWVGRSVRIEVFILTLGCAIILALVAIYAAFGNYNGESSQVNSAKYQAVFLNGGATSGSVAYTTYFGHITKVTPTYMILRNVYYLTTDSSSSTASASPQLTKLGCQQLHSPYDEMVINRSQVAFWENLQDNGKVVTAIKQFVQQNPNGPNCSQSASTNSSSSTNTGTTPTNSTSSSSTGTPTTGTPKP